MPLLILFLSKCFVAVSYVDSFAAIGDSVNNTTASDEEMTSLSSSDVMATLSEVVTSAPSLSSSMKMSDGNYIVISTDPMTSAETRSVELVDDTGGICSFSDPHENVVDVSDDLLTSVDVEQRKVEINIRPSLKRAHPGSAC